nr:PQQ-dependent sugar dehydrogenase [Gordonia araii]
MWTTRTLLASISVVLVAVVATACGGPSAPDDPLPTRTGPATASETHVVAMGLAAPWSIAFFGRVPLVSERDSGRILEIDDEVGTRVVATVDGVDGTGEGGLLGIAVRQRHLYAYYTGGSENRIARYPITGTAGSLALGRGETILRGIPSATYHNGGRIAFGPDGMLYATTGDAGRPGLAQEHASLAGKILRMTPTGAVPADNPFPGSLVYSLGHRNSQGIGWSADGRMFASEFGADAEDELNQIEAGKNYGWPAVEGRQRGDRAPEYTDPLITWPTDEASPSGIAVVGGAVVIANLRGERLRVVPLNDTATSADRYAGEFGRLRDVVVTPGGELWVLTNNTDGRGTPGAGDDRIVRVTVDGAR